MATDTRGSKERRPLVAGLEPAASVERSVEKQFVFAAKAAPAEPTPDARELKRQPAPIGRVPLSTRIRTDYATALKRASLERQLGGTVPNTLQDILEEALEPWLRANGYLS